MPVYLTDSMRIARQILTGDPARAAEIPPDSAAIITMMDADGTQWRMLAENIPTALTQLDIIEMQRGNYAGTKLMHIQIGRPAALLRNML